MENIENLFYKNNNNDSPFSQPTIKDYKTSLTWIFAASVLNAGSLYAAACPATALLMSTGSLWTFYIANKKIKKLPIAIKVLYFISYVGIGYQIGHHGKALYTTIRNK